MRIAVFFLAVFLTFPAFALDPLQVAETRYCGEPKRNAAGTIIRSAAVREAFTKAHPCPLTGLPGTCKGWQVDHVIPLACGGCDAVFNMQWLPVEIKTCAGTVCKDRWEMKVYCK